MKTNTTVDTAKLSLLLNELRLPAIKLMWPPNRLTRKAGPLLAFWPRSPSMNWPNATAAASNATSPRPASCRARPWQDTDTFAFEAVPMISKAQVMAIIAGDSWLEKGANLLLFGPPGGGKSHLAQPSALRSLRMAGGCSSPEQPTSSRSFRRHGETWRSRALWPSSTSSIS